MKRFLCLLAALAAAALLWRTPPVGFAEPARLVRTEYAVQASAGAALLPQTGAAYCRAQLSEEVGELYDVLAEAMYARTTDFEVLRGGYDTESFSAALYAIEADRPELFYIDFSNVTGLIYANGRLAVTLAYRFDELDIPAMRDGYEAALARLTDAVRAAKPADEMTAALLAHDLIIDGCRYSDTGALAHSAFGCLVSGEAVCDGYARAMQAVCGQLGIQCIVLAGSTVEDQDGVGHAWNAAQLDGAWYHIDATWDDYDEDDDGFSAARHSYFAVPDAFLSLTHSDWALSDEGAAAPACTEPSWLARQGLSGSSFSAVRDAAARLLADNAEQGILCTELIVSDAGAYAALHDSFYPLGNLLADANALLRARGSAVRLAESSYRYVLYEEQRYLLLIADAP